MTLDSIMTFVDVCFRNFSNIATLLTQRLSQVLAPFNGLGDFFDAVFDFLGFLKVDGRPLNELELLQVLFGTFLTIFLAAVIIKWFIDLVIPN